MPKLRNLRIINARFNDGKNIYEDFRMPFYGFNATFELVNGGGKSVLLMLLMQCILPKSSLTPERPFKDMFHGGDENRTTHVLAEWELEKTISDKKYLLTGFCAKRKIVQEEDTRSDEIQSFNYIYNYSKGNEFDIYRIPLCSYNNNEFVVKDYSKTWGLLKEKASDFNIRITDRKREYQEWLKNFNLLESEWNLIREINRRENYLKPHFANYKTSRTLIEGLLIRTIEGCLKDRESLNYENKSDDSSSIAEALYKSQESLKKLQEEQELLNNYDKLLSEVSNLDKENNRLIISFSAYGEEKANAAAQYNACETVIQKTGFEIGTVIEDLERIESSINNLNQIIENIELTIFNIHVNQAKKDVEKFEQEILPLENAIKEQDNKLKFSKAVNKYILIKKRNASILESEEILSNKRKDRRDLYDKINPLGKTLFNRISEKIMQLTERKDFEERSSKTTQERILSAAKNIGGKENQLDQNKKAIIQFNEEIAILKRQRDELTQRQLGCPQISSGLFTEDKIDSVTKYLVQLEQGEAELSTAIELLKEQLSQQNHEEGILEITIKTELEALNRIEMELKKFEIEKEKIQKIFELYGQKEIELCLLHLDCEIKTINEKLILQKNILTSLTQELEIIEQYDFSLGNDFVESLALIKERYPQSLSGAEYLKELHEGKRTEVLERVPWLPKTILLLDQYFKEIIRDPYVLPVEVQDNSPILASIDILRANKAVSLGEVFIPHRNMGYSKDVLTKERIVSRLKKEISDTEERCLQIQSSINGFDHDLYVVRSFKDRYPPTTEPEKTIELSKYRDRKKELEEKLSAIRNQIKNSQASLINYRTDVKTNIERKTLFEESLAILQQIRKTEIEAQQSRQNLENAIIEQKDLDTSLRSLNKENITLQIELESRQESLRQTNGLLDQFCIEIKEYQEFVGIDAEILSDNRDTIDVRLEYRSAKKVIDETEGSVSDIESSIASDRILIEDYTKDIQDLNISMEKLIAENPDATRSEHFIQQLQEAIKILEEQRNKIKELLEKAKESYNLLNLEFKQRIRQYQTSTHEEYFMSLDLFDSKPFDDELAQKLKGKSTLEGQILSLKKVQEKKERELKKFQEDFTELRIFNATHHFKNSMCISAVQFIEPKIISEQLERALQNVRKGKNKYEIAKESAIQNVSEIPIATEFKDIIKFKLKIPESFQEAEFNKKQLADYSQIIHSKIEIHQKTVDALKEVEAKIVDQALGMAIIYRDYLKDFSQMSKLDIDGKGKIIEMVRINFDDCIYPDDRAQIEMRRYIQDLNKGIRDGTIRRQDLQKSFRPEQLVGRVMEMGKLQVKIRKIEEESQVFQKWDMIKASDGQENTMYIIFLIALMSYIRNIVVGRYDNNTSKVLLLDNPFGSTGAFYLWEPIWSILKRNNIQLICSGHKISSKIREFFPVNHILTEEISVSGLRRVNIKVEATGEAREILERNQRMTLLHWTGSS